MWVRVGEGGGRKGGQCDEGMGQKTQAYQACVFDEIGRRLACPKLEEPIEYSGAGIDSGRDSEKERWNARTSSLSAIEKRDEGVFQ